MDSDFLYGVQYYRPPRPPRNDWPNDLKNIKKQGFNAVKIWAVWRWINPKPDKYNFEELDELFDEAEKNGLNVVCNIILENAPAWVFKNHPDTMGINSNGKPIMPQARSAFLIGGYPGICFDNPLSRRLGGDFIRQVVRRYMDRENLYAWDAWNEFQGIRSCYCKYTWRSFIDWLKDKYGDIENLNKVWCRNYADWEEIEALNPTAQDTFSDSMDWMRFEQHRVLAELRWRINEIRKNDGKNPVGCHTGAPTTLLFNINDWEAAKESDFYGSSMYYDMPPWGIGEYREIGLSLDTLRSAAKNFWISELQCGPVYPMNSSVSKPAPEPEKIINSALRGISHGVKAILYWQWRPEITGMEAYGFSLTNPDGSLTERCKAIKRIAEFIDENIDLLRKAKVPESSIAMMVNPDTFFLDRILSKREPWKYVNSIKGFYHIFNDLRLQIDIVTPEKLKADFKGVIIVPFPLLFDVEITKNLENIVNNGGTLIMEAMPGLFDKNGIGSIKVPGQGLKPLLGCERRGIEPGSPTIKVYGEEVKGHLYKEWYKPLTAEVIGKFDDGVPAILKNSYGDGEELTLGTFLGLRYYYSRDPKLRDVVLRLIASKIKKEIDVDFPLEIRKLSCGKENLYFIFNSTSKSITSPILFDEQLKLEDLESKKMIKSGDSITLPPWGVEILIGK